MKRDEAIKLGLKRYSTGKPCLNGHISDREVANHSCVQCRKERTRMKMTASESAYRGMKTGITSDGLNAILKYNKESGDLRWKSGLFRQKADSLAGCVALRDNTNYISVSIHGKRYLAHRLIFLMINGRLPESIDHIDGNGENNRLENIREVSHVDNMKNTRLNKKSSTGYCGVSIDKRRGNYRSYITVDGKQVFLGNFSNISDAVKARVDAEVEFGFHRLHGIDKN